MRPTPKHIRAACALLIGLVGCDDGASGDDPTGDVALDMAPAADSAPPDAAPPDAAPAVTFCTGAVAQRYDPFGSDELELFPDDLLTRADPDSPTGLRLALDVAAWSDDLPRPMVGMVDEMRALSGFGHNGAIILRFTAPLAPWQGTIEGSTADPTLMLFDLDADPPQRLPYSVATDEDGATWRIQPERPLRGGARHGLLLVDAEDADRGCVAPSPTLQELLTGAAEDPRLAALAPAYRKLLDAAGAEPEAVSAATVFTAHAEATVLQAIAAGLAGYPAEWAEAPVCEDGPGRRRCDGVALLWDYRDDRAVLSPDPVAQWRVAVRFELPPPAEAPPPLLMMGHGLDSSRGEMDRVAREWTPEGFAVVALDALSHGDHPTAIEDDQPAELRVAGFLGLDLAQLRMDSRRLTGNFDQTALDRIQLLDLLRRAPDLDGDGIADVDTERLGYYGISLGGLMGPAVMALDPSIDLAILQVPGGRLATFATSSAPVEQFMPLVINLFGSEARFRRMLAVLQAAVDRADPATWAPLAMARPGGPPHVLMQVSTFDDIVPPATGIALARALALPHVGEVIAPVPLLPLQQAPIRLNLPDGTASAGFTQFDRIGADDQPQPSGHHSLPGSDQALHQVEAFLLPWRDGQAPTVVDAYGERDTAPLP